MFKNILEGVRQREDEGVTQEYEVVQKIIINRANLIRSGIDKLGEATGLSLDNPNSRDRLMRLVATDLFVEKAQRFLTERATRSFGYGFVTLLFLIVILGGGCICSIRYYDASSYKAR